MADIIVSFIIIVAVGAALIYIRNQKKNGAHCIGCPSSGTCSKHCACSGGVAQKEEK